MNTSVANPQATQHSKQASPASLVGVNPEIPQLEEDFLSGKKACLINDPDCESCQ